jgi:hypothetical protein
MLAMKPAESLRPQKRNVVESSAPDRTAKEITEFFRQCLSKASAAEAESSVLEFCENVMSLGLLLLASRTTYRCEDIKHRTPVGDSDESIMVPVDFDRPRTEICNARVAYTLFGALAIIPDLTTNKR